MGLHSHDSTINKWAEIVNKEYLKLHEDKKATTTDLGHVKVDGTSLTSDANGTISISPTYLDDNLNIEIADVDGLQDKLLQIDQDLQNATPTQHTHSISDVTDLQDELDNKTDLGHTHVSADISDLESFVKQVIVDNTSTASPLSSQSVRVVVPQGSTSLPINIVDYNPTDYLLFLFDNTTKVFGDTFTIEESTVSTSNYEIRFSDEVERIEEREYEIVVIHGTSISSGGNPSDSMIHKGSTPPTDTLMAWVKI